MRPLKRVVCIGLAALFAGCAPSQPTDRVSQQIEQTGEASGDIDIESAARNANVNPLKELPVDDSTWTERFDGHFRKYSKRFFGPATDWRWFKAQGIAESGLRIDAKSWVGAKGIMQIMPVTYKDEIKGRLQQSWIGDITDPRWNIAAGIYYDHYLFELWDDIDRSVADRLAFMFSSYNCGQGRTLSARRKCQTGDCDTWDDVKHLTPDETQGYLKKIMALMEVEL